MQRRRLYAGIFLSCLLGTGIPRSIGLKALFIHSAAADTTSVPLKPVYPAVLMGRPRLELGEFILSAMPENGDVDSAGWPWGWQSEAPSIAWHAELSEEEGGIKREGIMRLSVMGDVATGSRETAQELGWDVVLSSTGNVAFGAERVSFEPHDCFDVMGGECTFNSLPSLKNAGITAHLQCFSHSVLGERAVYLIQHEKRAPLLLSWETMRGSDGDSQHWWLERPSPEALNTNCHDSSTRPLPDEFIMTARHQADIERYQRMAFEALNHNAAAFSGMYGQQCLIKLMVSDGSSRLIDASAEHNSMPLCDAVLGILADIDWPLAVSGDGTAFDINFKSP